MTDSRKMLKTSQRVSPLQYYTKDGNADDGDEKGDGNGREEKEKRVKGGGRKIKRKQDGRVKINGKREEEMRQRGKQKARR